MAAPAYEAADFLRALQALLPRGRVWPREPDAIQTKVASGLAQIYEYNSDRAAYLLVDSFPAKANELLPEWEESLGLPDPCAGLSPTIQQRQGQVVARLTNSGGQSAPYFIAFAFWLGFVITITNYSPFWMGSSVMGMGLGSDDWAHVWQVNAPLTTIIDFTMGQSTMGERLREWGNAVLECEFNAIKPAQSILLFSYT